MEKKNNFSSTGGVNGGGGINFDFKSNFNDNNFFKSSFARSMAYDTNNQSKSLDFMYFDKLTISEEESGNDFENDLNLSESESNSKIINSKFNRCKSPNNKYNVRINGYKKLKNKNNNNNGNNDAAKYWKRKQENFKKEISDLEKENDFLHNGETLEEELARLRQEKDILAEENRRLLHQKSHPSSPTYMIDVSTFQTQLDTLQWQLKQVESNRQMYRAVMEQISKYLERVQRCLEMNQTTKSFHNKQSSPCKNRSRVPRSRSVHTVANTSSNSRANSPSPTYTYHTLGPSVQRSHSVHHMQDNSSSVQRAHSLHHMQDTHSSNTFNTLRDFSWRTSRPVIQEEISPEKLTQETFRLSRTIHSLLNTREPDLAQRLTPCSSDLTLNERRAPDNNSVGSCSSLLQSTCGGIRKSLVDTSSSCSTHCEELEVLTSSSSPPQRSVKPPTNNITEDESGFSSMSSFHENGLPEMRTYPELGLPLVDTMDIRHKRWSSTPVDKYYHQTTSSSSHRNSNASSPSFSTGVDAIRVLWV